MPANLKPMPRSYLKMSEKYRPGHPPVFEGTPTPDEIKEARALFKVLDPESQRWYQRSGMFADLAV